MDVRSHDVNRQPSAIRNGVDLPEAEVPQVDHRVRQGLERIVQLADAIEAIEQAPAFVLPGKHPFNGVEAFFKNGRNKDRLATSPGSFPASRIGIDIRHHAAIKNGFSILSAIIDTCLLYTSPSPRD